jgi:fluoride exporter
MIRFLLVCLAGGAGTGARYLLGGFIQRTMGASFPYGTITINASGSFLISIIMYLGLDKQAIGPDLRVVLTTGVMGGFTTYSTFNYETLRLAQNGTYALAALNIAVTVVVCLVMGGLGLLLARAVAG